VDLGDRLRDGRALLPLRAFLGFTFCFAGLQKLANPDFFTAGSPISIQAQLAGATRRSPIHGLIGPLTHVAIPLGLLIAFAELAIGVGTLLGLWQRIAAAGGIVLSLLLFLTVSFHSTPFYTGADIVFAFAWTPLALAGAGSVLSADAALAARVTRPSRRTSAQRVGRREVVTGAVALATLFLGGVVAGLGRIAGRGGRPAASGTELSPSAPASTASPGATHAASGGGHPPGFPIGPANAVPVGGAAGFSDPSTSEPSIALQPKPGVFLAFDAVCPHAGCTVQYDQSAKLLVCPCHGSQFNASTGAVQLGPAATGLAPLKIAKGEDGQLYVS